MLEEIPAIIYALTLTLGVFVKNDLLADVDVANCLFHIFTKEGGVTKRKLRKSFVI